jgi:hypothetical protein
MDPLEVVSFYFFTIYFNIILPSATVPSRYFILFLLQYKVSKLFGSVPCTPRAPPPHPPLPDYADIFFVLKPTRFTNFSNLFWNETLHVSFQDKF